MTPTHRRTIVALLALAAALPAVSARAGGPAPVGNAFQLSPCVACAKSNPTVAGLPSGAFLTAFDVKVLPGGPSVQARSYKTTGLPSGAPFRVQTAATPQQFDAAVASNATGYVVAWSAVDTSNSDVWVQRFNAAGTKVGTAILVNDDGGLPNRLDTKPAVGLAADGSFVLAWIRVVTQPFGDGSNQIWARRFTAAGSPVTAPFQLSTGLVNGDRPSVCMDTLKRGVVLWTDADKQDPFEPSLIGIMVRRVSVAGTPLGAAIEVAKPLATEAHGAVSCGAGGTFVVAWQTDQAPAKDAADIVAQRFATTGARVGTVFVVNTETADRQRTPAIFHDAGGNFVVGWQDVATAHAGLFGQRFSAAGARLGTTFLIAAATPNRTPPSSLRLAPTGAANAFVAVWADYTGALFGRRFKIVP